jgi:hypothetical protein
LDRHNRRYCGLSVLESLSEDDPENDNITFLWERPHPDHSLDSFLFNPRRTEPSDLRDFLLQVHVKGWYDQSLLPEIIASAELVFATAKKVRYFSYLEEAVKYEIQGPEERRRFIENRNLVENFSFGSLLKKWLVNYFMLGLECDVPIIASLAKGLEKTIKLVIDDRH